MTKDNKPVVDFDISKLDLEDRPENLFREQYPEVFNTARFLLDAVGLKDLELDLEFLPLREYNEDEGEVILCENLFTSQPFAAIFLVLRDTITKFAKSHEGADLDSMPSKKVTWLKKVMKFHEDIIDIGWSSCYLTYPEVADDEETAGVGLRRYGNNISLVTYPPDELERAKRIFMKAVLKKKSHVEGPKDVEKVIKALMGMKEDDEDDS